jgi:GH25 family lysozyme M1 (1,4-beta-N-acetylmuramidase)
VGLHAQLDALPEENESASKSSKYGHFHPVCANPGAEARHALSMDMGNHTLRAELLSGF